MRPPKRAVLLGPEGAQVRVELSGDLLACIEYEDVADGQSLEELAISLAPSAERSGDELKVRTKRMKSRTVADLLFAFSANWRDDSGWNSRNAREADPTLHPRDRSRYLALAKSTSVADRRRAQGVLLSLLMETVFPPGETATAPEPAPR